jgi:fructose transport system permease protein
VRHGVTTLFGLLNGLLVTRIKLPPFIVTLGTLNIAFAITQLYSNSQTVTDLPPLMTWLGNTFALGGTEVAYGTVLMLALYRACLVLAARDGRWPPRLRGGQQPRGHAPGRHPHRPRAAGRVRAGRPVLRHCLAAERGAHRRGRPERRADRNLDAITAVVLGGTSLFGGRGVILGSWSARSSWACCATASR